MTSNTSVEDHSVAIANAQHVVVMVLGSIAKHGFVMRADETLSEAFRRQFFSEAGRLFEGYTTVNVYALPTGEGVEVGTIVVDADDDEGKPFANISSLLIEAWEVPEMELPQVSQTDVDAPTWS